MRIFNIGGPLFQFLNKMADLCVLNLLFLFCCLPVVTIGAAATALYSVTIPMSHEREGYIARSFFKAFRSNFKQATMIWIPSLAALFISLADIRIFSSPSARPYRLLLVGAYLIFFLLLFLLSFVFPVLAKFSNTTRNIVKNAFLIPIAKLPWAFLCLVVLIVPGVITAMLPKSMSYIYMLWLLFGFSLTALGVSYILDYKVFPKFISKP